MNLTLDQLNTAAPEEALQMLAGIYEHSPWIAEKALAQRPFKSLAALKHAMAQTVREAEPAQQLALIQAHPELAGKLAEQGQLTAESSHEQHTAGLKACSPEELAALQRLNAEYHAKFGWPFILAVRGPRGTGLTRQQIIATFARRLEGHADFERAECLRNIHRIAELRLNDRFGVEPTLGNQVWDCAELLAQHSDVEDALTVTYLTPAHIACQKQLAYWMRDCGFDEVEIDAVGNV
ncbi:MAG TPA: 2-oxo-4-hydroxy-4-carboxy-5-ureidoimidazoline decarboxylase, partial [Rhizobacter sp.]